MTLRSLQHDTVREHNRFTVLQALRERRVASRAELSRATALSVPTVATIGQEFVALGIVDEGELARSSGGRPARLLRLIPHARNVLTLDLSGPYLSAARVDLLGALHEVSAEVTLQPGLEDELAAWLSVTIAALDAAGTPVTAIAAAVPGVVDQCGDRVRLAPSLGWDDAEVGVLLSGDSGLPVLLENDVNAGALGELLEGVGRHVKSMVYLALAGGIGAGLVIDGALYRGSHNAAGEIGYSLLPGLPEQGLDLGASGPLERHLLGIADEFVIDGRINLTNTANRAAFERLVSGVRLTLHNLSCVLDPELVVVAWSNDPEGELARAVAERWAGPLPVEVRAGSLGPVAALHGVAHLALERLDASLCHLEQAEWSNA